MSQHFIFKRVFAHLYSPDSLANNTFDSAIELSSDGHLAIRLSTPPDVIDPGIRHPSRSVAVAWDLTATTPDGRYRVEVDAFEQGSAAEFWLIHINQASGKFKRVKLSAETQPVPQIAVSPGGTFFLADDNGIVRLYDAAHLQDFGVFEVAHAGTQNRIAALAVSADDRFVATLSCWKDFVLYDVSERRVVAIRHIDDPVGWYDPAYILILGHGAAIVTAGRITGPNAAVSMNVFRYISQNNWKKV